MNEYTMIGAVSAILILAAADAMAGDTSAVSIYGKRSWDPDQAPTQACLQQFVDRILPGQSYRIRMSSGGPSVFGPKQYSSRMDVLMEARLTASGDTLATGHCTVDRQASVHQLTTHVVQPERLAGLTARDLVLSAQR